MKRILVFAAKCLFICSAAFIILILLNNRYEKVMDNPYSDTDKFNYMDTVYQNIQICNVGSSHGEYSFYYEELSKQSGYECFNFAMASQTYNYDYAVLSMYKDHFADNSILFIPVSCFSFNNEVTNEKEQQSLSTKYYTFLSPKYIPDYDPYVDFVTHRFPILSAQEDIVKIFPKLTMKVFAEENNAPNPDEFREKANNRYQRHMENKEEYFMPERIDALYNVINFCKDNNITAVLITTPYTSFYNELFPQDFTSKFQETINQVSQDTGTPYYNYSNDERFSNHLEYFSDGDHLNTEGSVVFMDTIQKEIPEFQEFLSDNEPIHNGDPSWEAPF